MLHWLLRRTTGIGTVRQADAARPGRKRSSPYPFSCHGKRKRRSGVPLLRETWTACEEDSRRSVSSVPARFLLYGHTNSYPLSHKVRQRRHSCEKTKGVRCICLTRANERTITWHLSGLPNNEAVSFSLHALRTRLSSFIRTRLLLRDGLRCVLVSCPRARFAPSLFSWVLSWRVYTVR